MNDKKECTFFYHMTQVNAKAISLICRIFTGIALFNRSKNAKTREKIAEIILHNRKFSYFCSPVV